MKRSKQEAEMRLAMGVARKAMREGLTPAEAVQAIKSHRELVQSLDRPHAGVDADSIATNRCQAR